MEDAQINGWVVQSPISGMLLDEAGIMEQRRSKENIEIKEENLRV